MCGVVGGVRTTALRRPRLPGGVQGTVLYEGSDVRTVNGFVLPRNRGLEYCTMHRQNIAEETR